MEKIWLEKSYPPGVPHDIDPDRYASLVEMFHKYTDLFSENTAFINLDATISYKALAEKSRDFAAYLQTEYGLVKGDKFAIMLPNLIQYPVALFGALMAGLTVVNVNPMYTPRELEHQLKDSGAKSILIFDKVVQTLEAVIKDTPIENIILTSMDDRFIVLDDENDGKSVKYTEKKVPTYHLPRAVNFNMVLASGKGMSFQEVAIDGNDLAFLQYTGGTTGASKGVMLTHRNMVANLEQSRAMTKPIFEDGKELMVTAIPLYHIFALTSNCLCFIAYGGTNLLITNPRDMPGFVKELAKYPFSAITGVNTLFNGLLHTPGFAELDFSHLKISFGGGMPVQRAVAEKWKEVTNDELLEGYGLTECAPMVTITPYNQKEFSGTIGIPASSTDIRLVNDVGEDVSMGEPGEIWVKGPQVMRGYYNRKQETEEVLKDGWFLTGDIGTMDKNGYFKIVDRKKDMILVSGFNVYPNEIEEVMAMHSGVLEAGVIGVPSETTGEMIKVFVVRKDPSLDEQALIDHCQDLLTKYKIPKLFEFVDELPKSNVGKILRKELRQLETKKN